jgi:hypothetical protein
MKPVPPGHIVLVDGARLRNAVATDLYRAYCQERDERGRLMVDAEVKPLLVEVVGMVEVVPADDAAQRRDGSSSPRRGHQR